MAIKVKIEQEDLILYEIIKNPVLFGEFIYNLDLMSHEESFEFDDYQKEMICDFNSYESLCCARSVGKTTVLSSLITWIMVNDVYPGDYISYHVPGKNHVEPVFTRLVRTLRTNSFLKHYIDPKSGVNHSDLIIRLKNNNIQFIAGGIEDFEFLDQCEKKGAKYLITHDVQYFVGHRSSWK